MSENSRYEEVDQQFNDLPMPDQEESWQKMKELLDKDDDDDRIVPPIFLNSCLAWGALLLVGLTVVWLVVRPERWWNGTTKAKETSLSEKVKKQSTKEEIRDKKSTTSKLPINKDETSIITDPQQKINPSTQSPVIDQNKKPEPKTKDPIQKTGLAQQTLIKSNDNSTKVNVNDAFAQSNKRQSPLSDQNKNKYSLNTVPARNKKPGPKTKEPIQKTDLVQQISINSTNNPTKVNGNESFDQKNKVRNGDTSLSATRQQQVALVKDSVKTETVSLSVDSATKTKTKPSQRKFVITAGLGLQQLIPVAGQTVVPYNYHGGEGTLSDYIPSVFLQLHKKGKWYIMGEFRYGAPQPVKEFSYNQLTTYDTASTNAAMTTMHLKKTYYHQLPLSFNYYLIPNLSAGIGAIYSRFYGAITEKETKTWNVQTQANTISKEIIPVKNFTDSFLYKTQVHAFIQADYQWRRFSLGLRYTRDLQSYIRYTKPDGTIDEKKNQSLQLMIRYRLWQSENIKDY